jgi:uncharacterized protein
VQSMTGHGGWPLNVFLTPEQLPFYGGTYFPPSTRQGMPSWREVLQAISELWRESPEQVRSNGERLREHLERSGTLAPSPEQPREQELERALENLRAVYDGANGGFGGAPKFPQASVLEFLLLCDEREMSHSTLDAMAAGGIHDQLGGGFHRYSVDATWTVPHFEKMLYDNALLARAYLHGWRTLGADDLREACVDTLEWTLREMRGPEGGFFSALDADSEGVEGRFYVWTRAQLLELLDEDAQAAIAWLGVGAKGNFSDPHHPEPGLNVLTARGPRPAPEQERRIRERLLAAREQRPRPACDTKRLTAWNALMVSALADAGAELGEPRYTEAAIACAEFVLTDMHDARGRLLRSYNDGSARVGAFLEDHALLLEALIALFESTCDERYYERARTLADTLIERFADEQRGGFFMSPRDGEALIARRKDLEDSPLPSGSSSAALGLLRLYQLSGEELYERHALAALRLTHELAIRYPSAFGHTLQALYWCFAPARALACPVPVLPSPAAPAPPAVPQRPNPPAA